MSIITANITSKYYCKNSFFDLLVDTNQKSTEIAAFFLTEDVTTGNMPNTLPILKRKLPSILRSKCFNEFNFSFRREVRNTELGHLFEHILLEYICELKREIGIIEPVHNGITKWNWNIEKRGLFHISVDVGKEDEDILRVAIQNTSQLMKDILFSSTKAASPNYDNHTSVEPLYLELK